MGAGHRFDATIGAVAMVVVVVIAGCARSPLTGSDAASRPHPGLTDAQFSAAVQVARSEIHRLKVTVRIATAKMVRGAVDATNTGHRCRSAHLHIEILGSFPTVGVGGAARPQGASSGAESDAVHAELIDADPATARPCLIGVKIGTVRPDPTAVTLFTH